MEEGTQREGSTLSLLTGLHNSHLTLVTLTNPYQSQCQRKTVIIACSNLSNETLTSWQFKKKNVILHFTLKNQNGRLQGDIWAYET